MKPKFQDSIMILATSLLQKNTVIDIIIYLPKLDIVYCNLKGIRNI
jgi:hypothetical protein